MNSNTKTLLIATIMVIAVAAVVAIPAENTDAQGLEITKVDTSMDGFVIVTLNDTVSTVNGTISTADDSITVKANYDNPVSTLAFECNLDLIEGEYSISLSTDKGTVTYPAETPGTETVTITWQNYDGTVLATDEVAVGETPVYTGETPTRAADSEYNYTFAGWEPAIVAATADATYTAKFTATPIEPGDEPDADREFTNQITLSDGAVIDATSYINASTSQEIVVAGDVTIINGGYMIINGKLTIQAGATLTIENGGYIIVEQYGIVDVQGDLIAEAGSANQPTVEYGGMLMTVAGTVSLEGAYSFDSTDGKDIQISGLFEVGDEASANLDGASVATDGELVIYGVVTGTVANNGTITIDSQGFENGTVENGGAVNLIVDMKADATVDIINAYGTVAISDENLKFDATRTITGVDAVNDNVVTLTNASGVIVTETIVITQDGDKDVNGGYVGTNTMYVSGTVTTAVDYNGTDLAASIVIDAAGAHSDVEIAADTVLSEGVTMVVNGDLTVSANLTATQNITDGENTTGQISGEGVITVTGKITYSNRDIGVAVNAALYRNASPANYIYTTLETALTDGATAITLMGENTVTGEATIPVGTTVTMDTDSQLTVAEDATLTVAADDRNSARLVTGGNDVYVNGTMVVENNAKSRITADDVHSDTTKDVDGTVTYTNIYNALDAAADGETVELTQNVELKQNIDIASGVTLYVPSKMTLDVPNEITVTVDGTLYVAGGYNIGNGITDAENPSNDEDPGMTVVNGMFVFTNGNTEYYDEIAGAYFGYAYTFENRAVSNAVAVTPMASVPGLVDDITSTDVTIYGDLTVPAIDFSAYDGEGDFETVTIAPGYDVVLESVTLGDNVVLDTTGAQSITGSIVLANGTVELDNVNGIIAQNIYDEAEDVTTSYISGTVNSYDDPETEAVETGSVAISGEIATSDNGFVSNVAVDVPSGATLTLNSGDFNANVSVEGEVVIAQNGVTFDSLTVTGTVSTEDRVTATAVKMYVGVTEDDMAMAGTGSVAGVTISGAGSVAYVSPNATVEGDITDLNTTAYMVEGDLYLTAYATNLDVPINDVEFRVENARFDGWMYTKNDVQQPVGDDMMVGQAEEVYADIEYDIYNVTITADAGIGSVAVDGNVLANQGGNQFSVNGLAAGQHTISYTLKSGYEGEATLTVKGDNATVSGLNFTLSGTPTGDEQTISVELSLAGTTPGDSTVIIDNGGDDGLGLTDYLLIILVVLIVIMAIIVALRLMRS